MKLRISRFFVSIYRSVREPYFFDHIQRPLRRSFRKRQCAFDLAATVHSPRLKIGICRTDDAGGVTSQALDPGVATASQRRRRRRARGQSIRPEPRQRIVYTIPVVLGFQPSENIKIRTGGGAHKSQGKINQKSSRRCENSYTSAHSYAYHLLLSNQAEKTSGIPPCGGQLLGHVGE